MRNLNHRAAGHAGLIRDDLLDAELRLMRRPHADVYMLLLTEIQFLINEVEDLEVKLADTDEYAGGF